MKYHIISIIALFALLNACKNKSTEDSSKSLTQAEKITAIDTLASKIDREWKDGPNLRKAYISTRDSVDFLMLNNEPERISSIFSTDTTMIWVTFHQVNNELKLVRYREWRGTPKPQVKEAFSYLDDGKIFYSKERHKFLKEGEPWAAFREATFVENARTPDEMAAEYMPFWEPSKKAIEEKLSGGK